MQNCDRRNEESKREWLIKGRRENEEQEYHHKRKEVNKVIRNKKKAYIKNVIESILEDQKHNNTRKTYLTINQFKKGYRHKFNEIRNKK
jgi:3-methyladenine DNA glycosylase AlkC